MVDHMNIMYSWTTLFILTLIAYPTWNLRCQNAEILGILKKVLKELKILY